jgi:hypothetical protein
MKQANNGIVERAGEGAPQSRWTLVGEVDSAKLIAQKGTGPEFSGWGFPARPTESCVAQLPGPQYSSAGLQTALIQINRR